MRLACVQSNVVFNDPAANVDKAIRHLEDLKANGVDLAVFPEAYVTGYCVESLEDARKIAIPQEHPELMRLSEAGSRLQIGCIVGFAEIYGTDLFNTAVFYEPGEPPRFYRKTHLPELGYDKFVFTGSELPVFETQWGRIGILICFDLRPPEAMRELALAGADLVVLPTNWPAKGSAESGALGHIPSGPMAITRASENGIFLGTCDRVGSENGFNFLGSSKIVDPKGKVLAEAGIEEAVLVADINLNEARDKRNVVIPGKFETTIFDSRRPELYTRIGH